MLEPDVRGVLLEALRPPTGYRVDRAVATTFSLDLTALLTAPLAFSLFDGLASREAGDAAGRALADAVDPYALLQSVRAHAERLTVFCQAGRIANPPRYRRLLAYLESSVVQVEAPSEHGVFHPKLWALRFVADGSPTRYRVLCLSRNLTFDRSWDTMLVLDGELTDRTNAFRENHPLADFVAALPRLAVGRVAPALRKDVEAFADDLRRVRFEVPAPFEAMQFHPIGVERARRSPFAERIERLLIVSPFVAADQLAELTRAGSRHVLVSRLEQLQTLPLETIKRFEAVHVLHDAAEVDETDDAEGAAPAVAGGGPPPTGLHAKLYVADDGWNAHVWTGSANATNAAFGHNVELLVQLTGKKSQVGVEAILEGPKGGLGLRSLLAPYTPPPAPTPIDPVQERLEAQLRGIRRELGRARWVAMVRAEDAALYALALHAHGDGVMVPASADIQVWPITLAPHRAQRIGLAPAGRVADFGTVSFDALTTFFAFRVRVSEGSVACEEEFVVAVPLEGVPQDRAARILRSLLDDPAKVLRFLRLLLASDPVDAAGAGAELGDGGSGASADRSAGLDVPLFEALLRTLDRDPRRLDSVEGVIRDLSATEEGRRLLPPDLLQAWEPIRAARATLRNGGRA